MKRLWNFGRGRQMINLCNQKINHLKSDMLSDGVVIKHDVDRDLFWVSFKNTNDKQPLKFRYPDAFKNGFIEAVDKDLQQKIHEDIIASSSLENQPENHLTIEGILAKRKISELYTLLRLTI